MDIGKHDGFKMCLFQSLKGWDNLHPKYYQSIKYELL
jgi:hypothetical protein